MNDGTNTSVVWIGKTIPNGITTFQTKELALEALKEASGGVDRPFFLKHTVSNNTVTDSYVGFVVTEEMAQANPGMTAGTYYLKGKKTYELVEGSWQCMSEYDDGEGNCIDPEYNTNKATLLSAFGSSYCHDYSSNFYCSVSGLSAGARSDGSVDAGGGAWRCGVDGSGSSSCRGQGQLSPGPVYQCGTLVSYNLESEQAQFQLVRRGDFSLKNNPRVPKEAQRIVGTVC